MSLCIYHYPVCAYTLDDVLLSAVHLLHREELKRERIARVLEESLTSDYYLQARLGKLLHFQHPFTNPHPGPITVRLTWSDPELK